ncbi:hypothetical protein [Microvirga pudoricolor]|uniref:hypothetical protein n=1 Tax=Microvirga pudoricolor TaxID=2778729 RepID=UPI00194E7CC9|nr:hypothetical protein [Microvirga pudoricolor]MBM6594043.1 hypothetical protein [Microvirga pudoricolor]
MALSFRSIAVGLAALAAGLAVESSAAPAQAQVWYGPGDNPVGPYYRGGWGGPGYGYRPVYRGGYGYGPAYYGYRPRPYWRGYARPAYYGYGYGYGAPYGYYRPYDSSGAVVAGLIGGLALGAIANQPRPAYRPAYYRPASRCWYQPRRVVNRYGNVVVRQVRTCR